MEIKLVISAEFHPGRNKWSGLAVRMGRRGTHDNYDVLYNGTCEMEYFDSEAEAKDKAKMKAYADSHQ